MFSPTKIHVREPKRSGHHDSSNRTYLLSSDYTFAWENWHGETNAECNDINTQGWTSAAINIVLDFVMLGLPLPVIASEAEAPGAQKRPSYAISHNGAGATIERHFPFLEHLGQREGSVTRRGRSLAVRTFFIETRVRGITSYKCSTASKQCSQMWRIRWLGPCAGAVLLPVVMLMLLSLAMVIASMDEYFHE
jgi:hypothetical protein